MFPHKIRADMRVNGDWRKLVLVAIENERPQHLGLKLGAYLAYWGDDTIVEASGKHPALTGQPFRPDLLAPDITGSVGVWIECGNTTKNKLTKVVRRWPDARVAVFKETEAQGRRFRQEITKEVPRSERIEVYAWPEGAFGEWMGLLSEKTEMFGEVHGVAFNLVVNEGIYARDLVKC